MTENNVKQNFINYVHERIINDEELWTLKNLCNDYNSNSNMSQNIGPYKTIKLDRIKDLLILHF